ncbi:MAG: hypothetical protein KGS72_27845 [Cyanobacteria bacterium REEB67]|nr:hypothetical protein [Cyanobacteria bacterium REEB67]
MTSSSARTIDGRELDLASAHANRLRIGSRSANADITAVAGTYTVSINNQWDRRRRTSNSTSHDDN